MESTSSLALLPGWLWPGVIVPFWVLCMGQIERVSWVWQWISSDREALCQIVFDKDEHPLDKLCPNLLHLQFLVNNCVYSSHTVIKLRTYCLYRYTPVLIHEILYLAINSGVLTSLLLPHLSSAFIHSLHSFNLNATQNLMLDSCKMLQKQSEVFFTFLWHFFQV